MKHTTPIRRGALAAALAAAAALATLTACAPEPWTAHAAEPSDPLPPPRTEPPPQPAALAPAEPRAPELFVDKVRDAGIGAAVGAELARDPALAVAPVEVESVGGRVALRGTAPDPQARERAARIAAGVDGVVAVENALELASAGGSRR